MRTGDLRNNNDNHYSESIYENAAVLKSASLMTPVTNTIEKYEFGQMDEDDVDIEERVAEAGDTFEAVSFQVVAGGIELDEITNLTVRTWKCLKSRVSMSRKAGV